MTLRIRNEYREEVWAAIMYPSQYCQQNQGVSWAKKGWWHLNPGETKTVLGGDMSADWTYYFHANAPDGTNWGSEIETPCPNEIFDWCDNTSSTTSVMRGFDGANSNSGELTVRLTG